MWGAPQQLGSKRRKKEQKAQERVVDLPSASPTTPRKTERNKREHPREEENAKIGKGVAQKRTQKKKNGSWSEEKRVPRFEKRSTAILKTVKILRKIRTVETAREVGRSKKKKCNYYYASKSNPGNCKIGREDPNEITKTTTQTKE